MEFVSNYAGMRVCEYAVCVFVLVCVYGKGGCTYVVVSIYVGMHVCKFTFLHICM